MLYSDNTMYTKIVLPLLERQEADLALVSHLLLVDLEDVPRFPGLVVK